MLILDVFHEAYIKSFEEMQSVGYEQSGFWSPEAYVVMQRNQFYRESNNTLEQYLVITEGNCKCYNIWNQIYSQDFLEKEVTEIGLTVESFYDNVQGKEYTGLEDTICGVFRK